MTNITIDGVKNPVEYGYLQKEDVEDVLQEDNESVFTAASNTARVQEHSGFHLFDKVEWDPEIGDATLCKGALSKAGDAICGVFQGIGNFFGNIFKGIGNFFTGLFGGNKETDEIEDKNTEKTTNETEKTRFEGIPDEIIEEWGAFAEPYGDIYYDTDGELIVETRVSNDDNEMKNFYELYLGEVRYDYINDDGRRILGIAVNVKNESPSEENLQTRDGEISNTQQGQKGDCWLLSGVNALSYTEEGRKIIKDALEYHEGYTTVHLKGAKDYDITDKEVEEARRNSYSTGDDDMLILELAVQKAFGDVDTKDITLGSNVVSKNVSKNNGSIQGSNSINLIYLITGKEGEAKSINNIYPDGKTYEDELLSEIDNFEANNAKDFALVLSSLNQKTAEDAEGNEVAIFGPHAYAVKKVEKDTITLTNPHDSGVEITFSKNEALKTFDGFSNCDLSDENPAKPAELPVKTYEDGTKAYIDDLSYFNLMDATYYSKEGEKTGSFSINSTSNTIKKYDTTGKNEEVYEIPGVDLDNSSAKELLENIIERDLHSYKNLSLEKIVELARLNESEWQKARKNLS